MKKETIKRSPFILYFLEQQKLFNWNDIKDPFWATLLAAGYFRSVWTNESQSFPAINHESTS